MISIRKVMAATAIGAMTLVPLAACSSDDSSSTDSSTTSAAAASADTTEAMPAPAAEVDDLSKGVSTAVALDPGFTGALTTLGLTPGVVGTATLADGSIVFPITGGDVKYGPNDTAILTGTQVKISETAAGLLNDTFKTDAVTPGLLVGVATITIATA